ncbi:MAG: hypothetical protein KDK36_18570 [Leptospiraceae bacterium]|nr:hypothetical protein [Leptospiraceae bacterium]
MKLKITIILFLLTISSCISFDYIKEKQPGASNSDSKNYFYNRIMDLRDNLTLSYTYGSVFGLKINLGPIDAGLYGELGENPIAPSAEVGLRNGEVGEHQTNSLVILLGYQDSKSKNPRARLRKKNYPKAYHEYTRIGIAAGFLFGFHLEVNPGEFIDLLLGVFGVDIYSDDIYIKIENID